MPASKIHRTMYNIAADDLVAMRDFYGTLFELDIIYESDWYIVMVPSEGPRFELGIISRFSEVTPEVARRSFGGGYLTFVVEDVLVAFGRAEAMGADILEPPTDMFYGQRRMLLRDPVGTLLDISSPVPVATA